MNKPIATSLCLILFLTSAVLAPVPGAALALAPLDAQPGGGTQTTAVQPSPAREQAPVILQETPDRLQNRGPTPRNVIIVHPTPATGAGAPAAQPAAPGTAPASGAEPAPKTRATD